MSGRHAARSADPEPKRVVHVVHSFAYGGSELYAYRICAGLEREAFRPVMLALDVGGPLADQMDRDGIPNAVMGRNPGIDKRLPWRLLRQFRMHQASVVHTHHFAPLFYSAVGAKLVGARLIHTEHSANQIVRPRLSRATRHLSRLCYRVYAVSECVARVLVEEVGVDPRKVAVMRAGVDLDLYRGDRQSAREALGWPGDARIALCVARLSPEKNQVGLVRAFRSVADRMPDARLALAGDGPARAEVEAAIDAVRLQDRVLVLGNRSDVPVLLAAGDALVLASEREGLPLVVMEAMAAGRPVVATAVGDVPLAVRNGETGFVAPPGDEAALADALSAVLADPQCASELGRRGREIAEAEFDIRRMVAEHEGAYGGPRSG